MSDLVYDQMEELESTPNCAVSLPRYAKLIGYEEAAFWGVNYENQLLRGCDPYWTEYQRMSIGNALAEAQQEIEQVVGYPLCPTYISGTYTDNPRWVDQQDLRQKIITRYPRILAAGVPVVEIVGSASSIDYATLVSKGVGKIGPLVTIAQSVDEIKIFYPESNREIIPSKITISSGFVTIEIPKYRMVKQEFLNTTQAVDYDVPGNFLTTVDVRRTYTDPSTQGIMVRPNCTNNECTGGCNECTHTACIYLRDPYLGIVNVAPAVWDTDAYQWKAQTICGTGYCIVRLNYLAGVRELDLQAEMAIVRLAHAKMGRPPCACDKTGEMWRRDYDVTGAVTRERVNCPFGLSNGAWTAYKWAKALAAQRASIF